MLEEKDTREQGLEGTILQPAIANIYQSDYPLRSLNHINKMDAVKHVKLFLHTLQLLDGTLLGREQSFISV